MTVEPSATRSIFALAGYFFLLSMEYLQLPSQLKAVAKLACLARVRRGKISPLVKGQNTGASQRMKQDAYSP
jgi:hypothetical protein